MAVTRVGATLYGVVRITARTAGTIKYAECTQARDEASTGNLRVSATVSSPTLRCHGLLDELESILRVSGE